MGVLYLLAVFIAWLAYQISEGYYNNKSKRRTMTWYGTYYTNDGKMIDSYSGKYVRWYRNKNKDFIITNCLDVYRNISEEKRNIIFQELRTNHPDKMTVMSWNSYRDHHENDIMKGARCRDFKTGKFFCARRIVIDGLKEIDFYVDIESGKIVRRTDLQMKKDGWCDDNDLVKKIIKTNGEGFVTKQIDYVESPYETDEMRKEYTRI